MAATGETTVETAKATAAIASGIATWSLRSPVRSE